MLSKLSMPVVVLLAAATLTAMEGPAWADPPPGSCDINGCTAAGGQPGSPGSGGQGDGDGGGGNAAPDPCLNDPFCAQGALGQPAAPAQVPTAAVLEMAMDQMYRPIPEIHTSPGGRTYVSLRTFLWIDQAQWGPQRAEASVSGQRVSAESTPTAVEWNLGETTINCSGPGTPYRAGAGEDQASGCSYTYKRSSANQPGKEYQISATIRWHVTWRCRGACDSAGGDLGVTTTTGTAGLGVGEIQSISGRD